MSAQALTVGDFFPSSIENPSVYLNSILGTNRFLFSDDDYNVANFTYASGHRSANLVSAQSKTFAGYSQNGIAYSLGFNYSWAFGHSERTITLAAPNYVRFHFAFNAPQSNATSFTSRLIATSGETLAFIQKSENAGTLSVTLRDREEITISLIATSSTSIGAPITFYQNDSITRLPTLTFVASSQGPDVALEISMQIATINVGPKIIFYNAFDLLKEYKIDYLVLDRNAYSQQVRFLNSRLPISLVYSNSKVVILKLL